MSTATPDEPTDKLPDAHPLSDSSLAKTINCTHLKCLPIPTPRFVKCIDCGAIRHRSETSWWDRLVRELRG